MPIPEVRRGGSSHEEGWVSSSMGGGRPDRHLRTLWTHGGAGPRGCSDERERNKLGDGKGKDPRRRSPKPRTKGHHSTAPRTLAIEEDPSDHRMVAPAGGTTLTNAGGRQDLGPYPERESFGPVGGGSACAVPERLRASFFDRGMILEWCAAREARSCQLERRAVPPGGLSNSASNLSAPLRSRHC